MIKTVKDLIEKLQTFDPNMRLDVDCSWYDRSNYNHVHRDIWLRKDGIELCVMETDPEIVCISNMNTEDMYVYE